MTDGSIPTGRAARGRLLGRAAAEQAMLAASTRLAMVGRSERARELLAEQATIQAVEHMVALLGSMKGAAMKLGQMMSLLDLDMLPESHRERIRDKLATLRDRAPHVPFATMRRVVETELGPITKSFTEFDEEPVAAASIGQVHRARLCDGRSVAVKIQYPGVDVAVRADLKNLATFAKLGRSLAPAFTTAPLVDEVRLGIESELDYQAEAFTQRHVAQMFRDHPFIVVPDSVPELCTRRVLVTEYFEGRSFDDIRGLPDAERARIGELIQRFYIGTLFTRNEFCGDPHPGNVLLGADGSLAFVDFGLFRRMDPHSVELERRCLCAAAEGRAEQVRELLILAGALDASAERTPDECLDYVNAAAEWSLVDTELVVTPAIATAAFTAAVDPRHTRPFLDAFRLPPEHAFSRRAEFMVLGVLGQLEARANWHRIAREWLYGEPPVTDIGKEIADWRRALG